MPDHGPAPSRFAFHADDQVHQFLNVYPQSLDWLRSRTLPTTNSRLRLGELVKPADPQAALLSLALSVCGEPWSLDTACSCDHLTIDELIDHLISVHHDYTRAELGRLACIADHLRQRQPSQGRDWFPRFDHLRRHLLSHMAEEEQQLFPACRALEHAAAQRPISSEACTHELTVMEHGHRQVLEDLEILSHELTTQVWPQDLTAAAQAMVLGLKNLTQDVQVHGYKEEEYLLPATIHAEERFDARHRSRVDRRQLPAAAKKTERH